MLHDLSSLYDHPLSDHEFLHKLKVLIFLVKACQLMLDDSFNFILIILMFVFLGIGLLIWVLIVLLLQRQRWDIWGDSVGCEHLRLGRWLPCWAFRPPCVNGSSMGFDGCVQVAYLGYMGGYDNCFSGGKVLASGRLGCILSMILFRGSIFG
jgi:hypothetical protein